MLFTYLFIYNSVLFPQKVWVRVTCQHYHHITISGVGLGLGLVTSTKITLMIEIDDCLCKF